MSGQRRAAVGQFVKWHDAKGVEYDALVTAVWSETCINILVVSNDETRQDQYGRQIERHTSQVHKSFNNVHGFYWRFADEEPNAYQAPAAV